MNTLNVKMRLISLVVMAAASVVANAQLVSYEYWFDNQFGCSMGALSGSEATVDLSIDTRSLSYGFHTFNIRAQQSDGMYSPVYTSSFLKFETSESSMLEYWFDDKFDSRKAVQLLEAGDIHPVELDMTSVQDFPYGLHQLNMRVAVSGNFYSPVYSAHVVRLAQGTKSQLTYWLDDDYAGRRVVTGIDQNGIANITNQLDFSSAHEGFHKLKMRVSSNDFDEGVIYEYALLVKSRYNASGNPTVVLAGKYWCDEDEPSSWHAPFPNVEVTHTITLDPEDYEPGQHVLYLQYMNSATLWCEPNATYFCKYANNPNKLVLGMYDEEAAEIDITTDTPTEDVIYDLSGRRVQNPTRGFYIINGKKTLLR